MSGGSWEYVYIKFGEVAYTLSQSNMPERRALGELVSRVAAAMHAVEWVDSGDWGNGEDVQQIRHALGANADAAILGEAIKAAEAERQRLDEAIQKARSI